MSIIAKLKFYYLIPILLLFSCGSQDEIVKNEGMFKRSQLSDSLSFYFPTILNDTFLGRNQEYKNFAQNWYSSALYSLKEPIIYNKNDSQNIYRFLWLRSFHQPVSFIFTEFKNQYFLNAKMLDRQPSFYPTIEQKENGVIDNVQKADRFANITFDQIRKVDKKKWNSFEVLLKENNFWNLNSLDNSIQSYDGSEWILEAYKDQQYHFVVRQNAQELRQCGEYLIRLSKLNLPRNVIY